MAISSFAPASTNIGTVSFDDETDTLTIEFVSGDSYDYMNVSPATYRAFAQAPSAGQFFQRNIKGRYSYDGPK